MASGKITQQGRTTFGIFSQKIILLASEEKTIVVNRSYVPFFLFGQRRVSMTFWNAGGTVTKSNISDQDTTQFSNSPIVTASGNNNIKIKNAVTNAGIELVIISTDPFYFS